MTLQKKTTWDSVFKKEVFEGLNSYPKYLSSKFIYDKKGDELFQDIMAMPEYYLTDSEYEIFDSYTVAITNHFKANSEAFDLIELGAGDGKKTKILLKYLTEKNIDFCYKPIDISQNAIDDLTNTLKTELPKVNVEAEKGEYFEVLERLKTFDKRKKVIMFLGSNIGNLLHSRAIQFLSKLREAMSQDDLLFIGFDKKKNPQTILNAYNDPSGITAAFNKNLLTRINSELGGDFDLEKFIHWELYNPETGTAKSFLVANKAQSVHISALDVTIDFSQWETIHTEISQKYDDKTISWLAKESKLTIADSFSGKKNYYKNYIFKCS
jgi:L-histidine N-alpha-methyltransferase